MNSTVIEALSGGLRYSQDHENNGRAPELRATHVFPTLAEIEREHILKVYQAHALNKSKTARVLGIDVKTLYNKLKAYGYYSADDRSQDS